MGKNNKKSGFCKRFVRNREGVKGLARMKQMPELTIPEQLG